MKASSSLRAKLALALALAAAIPLIVIGQLSTRTVRREFERSTERQFDALRRLVEARIASEASRVSARVSDAAGDYSLRDAALAYEGGGGPSGAHARLIDAVGSTAARLGLGLLTLVRDDGLVVASAEERARFDVSDERLASLARRYPGRAFLSRAEGLEVRGLALRGAAPLDGVRTRFWLVGGTLVDPDLLAEVPVAEHMALLLVTSTELSAAPTAGGREALAALAGQAPIDAQSVASSLAARGFRALPVRLGGVGADDAATFLLATSLRPLEHALGEIARRSLWLLLVGLLLAWLLAYVLSRLWSDPIAALVAGFERVAAGDLDVALDIRRGDELGRLVEAFHAMTRDLAESRARLLQAERIAAWREIARQLAHEIKNPLAPIALSMETLRRAHRAGRGDFPALLEECTGTVLEEVERLRRIVQEFSDFARLPRPKRVNESFHEVVRGVVALYSGEGRSFVLDLEPGEGRFEFDPDQMNRLLINLVKNAFEAMPGGGAVHISTRTVAARDRFVVVVADEGPGVPLEAVPRLFEPYVSSKAGGTGLGLAIVGRIAEEHGGSAALENPGEAGARFRVELRLSALAPESS